MIFGVQTSEPESTPWPFTVQLPGGVFRFGDWSHLTLETEYSGQLSFIHLNSQVTIPLARLRSLSEGAESNTPTGLSEPGAEAEHPEAGPARGADGSGNRACYLYVRSVELQRPDRFPVNALRSNCYRDEETIAEGLQLSLVAVFDEPRGVRAYFVRDGQLWLAASSPEGWRTLGPVTAKGPFPREVFRAPGGGHFAVVATAFTRRPTDRRRPSDFTMSILRLDPETGGSGPCGEWTTRGWSTIEVAAAPESGRVFVVQQGGHRNEVGVFDPSTCEVRFPWRFNTRTLTLPIRRTYSGPEARASGAYSINASFAGVARSAPLVLESAEYSPGIGVCSAFRYREGHKISSPTWGETHLGGRVWVTCLDDRKVVRDTGRVRHRAPGRVFATGGTSATGPH